MLAIQLIVLVISLAAIYLAAAKRPDALIYLLGGAVAFDISRTWYPNPGGALGTLTLVRLVTVGIYISALYCLWTNSSGRQKLKEIMQNPLTWALGIYILISALSLIYSATKLKTLAETIRLGSLIALYIAIGIIAKPTGVKRLFQVVHWVGVCLFPLAFYERVTGKALWLPVYAFDQLRVNATFVDPNIYARFLVLAVIANLVLQLIDKQTPRVFYYIGMLALLAQVVWSVSRSGLVTLAVVLVLLLSLLPDRRILIPAGLLTVGGLIFILAEPQLVRRVLETARHGLTSYDPDRAGLWRAAIAMFKDHPVFGIGLGGFEQGFLNEYGYTRLVDWGATLSHTTLLTIAAELGLVGLIGVSLVGLSVGWNYLTIRRMPREEKALGTGLLLWIITVLVHSQFEARLFEDPILWLAMAIILLMVKIPTFGTKY